MMPHKTTPTRRLDTTPAEPDRSGRARGAAGRAAILTAVTKAGAGGLTASAVRSLTGLSERAAQRHTKRLVESGAIRQDQRRRVYPVADAAGREVAAPDARTARDHAAAVALAGDRERVAGECAAVAAAFDKRTVPLEWRGRVDERSARLREVAVRVRRAAGRAELDGLATLAGAEVQAAGQLRVELDAARETAQLTTRQRNVTASVGLRRIGEARRELLREQSALHRTRTLAALRDAAAGGEPAIIETGQAIDRPHGVAGLLALYDGARSGPTTRIVSAFDPALVASSRDLTVWGPAGRAFVAAAESQIAALLCDLDRQETAARANGARIPEPDRPALTVTRTRPEPRTATTPMPLPLPSSASATSCTECHRPAVVTLAYGDPDLGGDEYTVCAVHARIVRELRGAETTLGRLTAYST